MALVSRHRRPSGVEIVVTKGGDDVPSDGDLALVLKDSGETLAEPTARPDGQPSRLGQRYRSADGSVELLVLKSGPCDRRYNGEPMRLIEPGDGGRVVAGGGDGGNPPSIAAVEAEPR